MRVILFGATGMVGQGVLRECLLDPDVEAVLTVGRSATGQKHEKLRELVHKDLLNFTSIEIELTGYDACFFCLGITSAGTPVPEYEKVTYDVPVAAAQTLVKLNPGMTFVHISGSGADSSGTSRAMWARVKGKTENALLAMPFNAVYVFRPAYIQPLNGNRSRTGWYNAMYAVMAPLYPLWKALIPAYVTTTEQIGRAMIVVAQRGYSKRILGSRDISEIGSR